MFENSKLSRHKTRKIVECFCIDIDATKTALLLKLNRKTVNRYYLAFRLLIHAHQLYKKDQILGVAAATESSYDAAKSRGPIKCPVFGIYEHDGSVFTELVTEDSLIKTLRAVIRGKVPPKSLESSDGWKGYDGLVDVGQNKHLRISKTDKSAHIDAIEAFWSFTKRRLAKFNGTQRNFDLHLHECEWRYNRSLSELLASLYLLLSKNKGLMV